uniref:WD40 repeat-containing protein n=1 Tax=Tanacetum cinerariifolium TaxID=118510 RepID=A0A6L2LBG2_TANCI|nr:WD40 repeat-containing protein [Tanacetum cinerariifolium]
MTPKETKSEAEKDVAAKAAFEATFKDVEKPREFVALSNHDGDEEEDLTNKPIGPVKVKVSPEVVVRESEDEGIVKDMSDGSYTVSYVVPKRENCMLSVECDGRPIMGSPHNYRRTSQSCFANELPAPMAQSAAAMADAQAIVVARFNMFFFSCLEDAEESWISPSISRPILRHPLKKHRYYHPSPICYEKHYREYLIATFLDLKIIDNQPIRKADKDRAAIIYADNFEYLPYKRRNKESVFSILKNREIKNKSHYSYSSSLAASRVGCAVLPSLHPLSVTSNSSIRRDDGRKFHPRKFEYHPTNPNLMVIGTVDGEVVVVNHESEKIVCYISSHGAMNIVLGLCWLKKYPSKVIKAFHGNEAGIDLEGCQTSGTWAKIMRTINHLHSNGIVPLNSIRFKVGDGSSIRFWKDTWLGNDRLYIRYNRLFHLENNKDCFISQQASDDEMENVTSETFCVWRPKAESKSLSPSMTKIEGKQQPMVLITPKKVDSPKPKSNSGEVLKSGSWLKAHTPVHELFYVQRRTENEIVKNKSFLSYRQDLFGLFGNVNGIGKMLPF